MIVLEGCGADEVGTLTALELFDPELTNQLYREESEEVSAYLMTRKTNTLWITND